MVIDAIIERTVWAALAAATAGPWVVAVCLCTFTWVQRQVFYAHRLPIWLGQNLDKPETFGFLKNQVTAFYIPTPDGERLYSWLIVPLKTYADHQSALIEEPLGTDNGIESKLAFKLLARDPDSRLIIYFHGNAGTVGQTRRTEAYRMVSSAVSAATYVLCFDYRGFGRSTGSPTESGLIMDATSVITWALERTKISPSRIVIIAQSLGTAVASAAACRFVNQSPSIEFGGILLCAAFRGAATVFLEYRALGLMPLLWPICLSRFSRMWFSRHIQDRWRTEDRLIELVRKSINLTITFLHAKNDNVIPWNQADSLFYGAVGATSEIGLTKSEIDKKRVTTQQGDGWTHQWICGHRIITEVIVPYGGKNPIPVRGRTFNIPLTAVRA